MAMQLVVVAGPDKGRVFDLSLGDTVLIGRSQGTQTRLTDPHVSRIHCEVQVEDDRVVVHDSNSAGGTFVNSHRITRQDLRPGDLIQVGSTQLRLEDTAVAEQSTLAPGALPQPKGSGQTQEHLLRLTGQILGRYEIGPAVAKGQSSVIFQARDTADDETVALKILQPEFTKDEAEVAKFIRAMKTVMPLRHENLVAILGAGRTGNYCWVAMEFVEGESLTQVIQRIGVANMLDWRYALRVAIHVARALEFAHENQIIHRNITPTNILVRSSDKVTKLADLMHAKALEGTLAQQITRPGELVGEIRYMSPEGTRGTSNLDGRSDIYSLGATVYALLTGRPPFQGGTLMEAISKIRQAEPEKPKKFQLSIPDLFEGTVLKMLAKRPEDRYQTPTDLLVDLERVAKFQGLTV